MIESGHLPPWRMLGKAVILVLLLVCRGYMGQVHPNKVSLENITTWADCIFLVRKVEPYDRTVQIEIDGSGKYPPYDSYRRNFKIIKVVKDESGSHKKAGDSIEVRSAYDGLMLHLHRMYYLEGRSKSPILNFYHDGESEIDGMERLIIFVSYEEKDQSFSFCAHGSAERESMLEEVVRLMKISGKPGRAEPN